MQRDLKELVEATRKRGGYLLGNDPIFWCVKTSDSKEIDASKAQTPIGAISQYSHYAKKVIKISHKWIDGIEMHIQDKDFLSNGVPLRLCIMKIRRAAIDVILRNNALSDEAREELEKKKGPREYKLADRHLHPTLTEREYGSLRGDIWKMNKVLQAHYVRHRAEFTWNEMWTQIMLPLFPDLIITMA